MFNTSFQWLLIVIDVSVKSVLLAAVAVLLLRLLKIRDSGVRHHIWAGVLLGMLSLPVLSQVLPTVPLPFSIDTEWMNALATSGPGQESLPEPALTSAGDVLVSETADVQAKTQHLADTRPIPAWQPPTIHSESNPFGTENDSSEILVSKPGAPEEAPVAGETQLVTSLSTSPAPSAVPFRIQLLLKLPVTVIVVWLAGTTMMCLRLLLGLLATSAIVHRADNVKELIATSEVPVDSSLDGTRIRQSSELRVPVTVGLFQPCILLPEEWQKWSGEKRQAVLTHELTHVERRDFLFAVLAEINRCLYWFHPLSWWLRTRLSDLAEEACDDAAIGLTGDPASYAKHLLEVAASLSRGDGRVCQPGLSMARQSNVEGRIHTILDLTRPLSERLSWKMTVAIAAVMIPVIAAAAALKPGVSTTPPAANADTPDLPGTDDAPPVDDTKPEQYTLTGQVTDPTGKPTKGVELYLTRLYRNIDVPGVPFATTDVNGCFSAAVSADECNFDTSVIAIAPRTEFGFGHQKAIAFDKSGKLRNSAPDYWKEEKTKLSSTIQLRQDDVPIRGRVLTAEGLPVVGARIEVLDVLAGRNGNLDNWVDAAKKDHADYRSVHSHVQRIVTGVIAEKTATTTASDESGYFSVTGIGKDRIVGLAIHGPNIASAKVRVRTQAGHTIRVADETTPDAAMEKAGKTVYEAAEFTHVADTTQPVEGTITSRKTGQPIAGCIIRATKLGSSGREGTTVAGFVRTETDAAGKYRLEGLPLGVNRFSICPPRDSDFIQIQNQVKTTASPEPFERNVSLVTGVRVRGRVTDIQTNKPAKGYFDVFPYRDNPLFKGKRRIRLSGMDRQIFEVDREGNFEALVVPGKGVLGFRSHDYSRYRHAVGVENLTGAKVDYAPRAFDTVPHFMHADNYHAVFEYDVAADTETDFAQIHVDSGGEITLKVVDEAGNPVQKFSARGTNEYLTWQDFSGDTFKVTGLNPAKLRHVFVWDKTSNQVGSIVLEGNVPNTQTIRLQAAGRIRGRVIDKAGKPVADLRITSASPFSSADDPEPDPRNIGVFPGSVSYALDTTSGERGKLVTDEQGRFEISGVLPDLIYGARAFGPPELSDMFTSIGDGDGPMMRFGVINIFSTVTINAGETKDLGDITIGKSSDKEAAVIRTNATESEPPGSTGQPPPKKDLTISGRIVSHANLPSETRLSVHRVFRRKAYALPRTSEPVMTEPVRADGRFQMTIPAGSLPRTDNHWDEWLTLQVKASGFGFVAKSLHDIKDISNTVLELPKEQQISGRILNLEGQPIAGAKLRVLEVIANETKSMDVWLDATRKLAGEPNKDGMLMMLSASNSMFAVRSETGPKLKATDFLIPVETFHEFHTDNQGRFRLTGFGTDQMLHVAITGPGIAKDVISVIARPMKSLRGESRSHLNVGGSTFYGSGFDYVAAQSAPVTGIVQDMDTKKPIPGAVVSVSLVAGSPMSRNGWLTSVSDENGRYELKGLPTAVENSRFPNRITVLAHGKPYLKTDFALPSSESADGIEFHPKLRQAVLATGTLTDLKTGEPIQGRLYYTPFTGNPSNTDYAQYADDVRHYLGNDPDYQTDQQGRFRIPVIPGRGLIGVICRQNVYRAGFGLEDIREFEGKGRNIAYVTSDMLVPENMHVVKAIDVPTDADTFQIDLQADPGKSVDVRLVDSAGKPLTEALGIHGLAARMGGFTKITSGMATVTGLEDSQSRMIYVTSDDRSRAALATITGDSATVTVVVPPRTEVVGQLVGVKGRPLKNRHVTAAVPDNRFFEIVRAVKTDDEGYFRLQVPAGGPYRVMAEIRSGMPVAVKRDLTIKGTTQDIGVVALPGPKKAADRNQSKNRTPEL